MKQRDVTIDIAKGVGIILMVLGHCPGIPHILRNFIFSFHMPLFLILSGYFYKEQSIPTLFKKGWKSLVVPYLITSAVCIILCFTAQQPLTGKEKMIGTIMSNGGWPDELWGANLPYIGPIWFLLALFWCKIFYQLFKKSGIRMEKTLIVTCCISTVAFIVGKYIVNLPFGILTGACALVFYAMGDYWKSKNFKPTKLMWAIGIVLWLACIWKSKLSMASFNCKHYPITMAGAFIGTYVTYHVSRLTPGFLKKLLCTIGENTMLILCYHTISDFVMRNVSQYYLTPNCIELNDIQNSIVSFVLSFGLPLIHVVVKKAIASPKVS